ncbi:hypothetical protein IGI04_034291 [Brassica rapa subsp. trilocularis]|uniref:RNase H type-1 domain-containing protein n=1 Tax=Brassica rapa subsp. trilocularis TaxID=1813537 RepID=A0ABQ7LC43_BRACM|nr:hypothetical protein IGI04_034291 [Brassica rapa subsp. trilocularis]
MTEKGFTDVWSMEAREDAGCSPNVVTLNILIDGCCKAKRLTAGLGWTITDDDRTRSFSTATPFVVSPLIVEGLALREAVWSCQRLGYTNVCCESDSTRLIQAVNSGSTATEIYGITADIISLAGLFETIFFRWISRVKNSEADGLAKQCLADEIAFN